MSVNTDIPPIPTCHDCGEETFDPAGVLCRDCTSVTVCDEPAGPPPGFALLVVLGIASLFLSPFIGAVVAVVLSRR